jgi:hypothetical protein
VAAGGGSGLPLEPASRQHCHRRGKPALTNQVAVHKA